MMQNLQNERKSKTKYFEYNMDFETLCLCIFCILEFVLKL